MSEKIRVALCHTVVTMTFIVALIRLLRLLAIMGLLGQPRQDPLNLYLLAAELAFAVLMLVMGIGLTRKHFFLGFVLGNLLGVVMVVNVAVKIFAGSGNAATGFVFPILLLLSLNFLFRPDFFPQESPS